MAENVEILLGQRESDHLLIEILGRERPDDRDYWDGNWLVTPISFELGRFHGRLPADLRTDELRSFRQELETLYRDLNGAATLTSLDAWLTLTVRCESRGQLRVEGVMDDQPGTGNKLHFSLNGLDQSFLPPILEALRGAEAAFPVRSDPNV
jgi:hypothetical protein